MTAWAQDAEQLLGALEVSCERGLTTRAAAQRLHRYGPNLLRHVQTTSAGQILVNQLKSLVVVLLLAATAISFAFGEWIEGTAIGAAILIAVILGFVTELRAVRAMEAIRRLGVVNARVRRDGADVLVPAQQLVVGDIVLLEGGDRLTADIRIIEASKLRADESTLTGESVPVDKRAGVVAENTLLAERCNMLYKGTVITRGSGLGVVTATGMATELGRIAALVDEAEDEETPLEKRLEALAQRLLWVSLGVAAAASIGGIARGKELFLMMETGIALAVAAIPEGLPIVATMALARGMWRMARHNALINRLSAVETLGACNIIVADKTGTLTENRLEVTRVALHAGDIEVSASGFQWADAGDANDVSNNDVSNNDAGNNDAGNNDASSDASSDACLRAALEVVVLCNNAALGDDIGGDDIGGTGTTNPRQASVRGTGDPLELALLAAGNKAGINRAEELAKAPEHREEAFDSTSQMMATYHALPGSYRVAVKGSPEAVILASTHVMSARGEVPMDAQARSEWLRRSEDMAHQGLRVLAVAHKIGESPDIVPYRDLVLIGLMGMLDPPRYEVMTSIAACHDAGIRVIMATGDQPVTAQTIARTVALIEPNRGETYDVVHGSELASLGTGDIPAARLRELRAASIFARVTPAQKLDIITLHQTAGSVVAMTGDGVNDAPALAKADIGVAMGKRGTDVAREAADMILLDDAFSSIVVAIRQGRVIFQNIRRFVVYLLSCNLAEVLIVAGTSLSGAPLPILPLQILFLNLVTDVFPALALGFGEGDRHVLVQPPRPANEPILTRAHWTTIVVYGLLIAAAVLGAFAVAHETLAYDGPRAVAVSFSTLAFAQLWHVFDMRDRGSHLWRNDVVTNAWVWGAVGLTTSLVLAALYAPYLSTALGVVPPGLAGWAVILGMSALPMALGQIWLSAPRARKPADDMAYAAADRS